MLWLAMFGVAFAMDKTVTMADFRTQFGACERGANSEVEIDVCLRLGAVNTLHDDPKAFTITTSFNSDDIQGAEPDGYQIQVLRNGVQIIKAMGRKGMPDVVGSGFLGLDMRTLKQLPQVGEVYTVIVTPSWRTDLAVTRTFTIAP